MTLLIGLGAAKAGTTWLHRYLADHPSCHAPPVKEMHWFDTVHTDWKRMRRDALLRERDRIARKGAPQARLDRIARYADLFKGRPLDDADYLAALSEGAEHRLRFEITPAYSILPEAIIERMAALEGGTAKFLFVMRDPVRRMWSNIRMGAERKGRTAEEMATEALSPAGGAHLARSAYGEILPKLRRAIPEDRLLVLFYEELFRQETLDRLCAFAEIGRLAAPSGRRVNGGTERDLDPALAAMARERLDPHYDAVRRLMGRVPEAWMAREEMTR